MLNMLRSLLVRLFSWLSEWIASWGGTPLPPPSPTIASFTPSGGWPGSIVTISGSGFTEVRDDHLVTIGGARALVITASTTELMVMAGELTVSGPIQVTVLSTGTVSSASHFE